MIRQQQLPNGPDALWRAVTDLRRQLAERTGRLLTVLRRSDQSTAATLGTSWAWQDMGGVTVLAEDPVAGAGLARPYIPMSAAPARWGDWLASTAASWEDVHRFTIARQQAYAYLSLGTTTDVSGTTGQVQVTVNGLPIASPISVSYGVAATTVGPFALPGAVMDQVEIRVQAQRIAGTGAVRVGVLAASQIQA